MKWIAILLLSAVLIALALMATGCTTTNISTPHWSLKRTSFLQRHVIPLVTISSNGLVTLQGYENDGGSGSISAIASGVAEGVVKGFKP